VAIAAGERHTCALKAIGIILCWGLNLNGQLGDGTLSQQQTAPAVVTGMNSAVAVAAGRLHTCAIQADGLTRCWGDNGLGQHGNGTQTDSAVAVSVSGTVPSISANEIAAGNAHTCAARANSTVACWGSNSDGQLGIGSSGNSFASPISLGNTFTRVITLETGGRHSCAAFLPGASVTCWGRNSDFQLVDGSTTQRTTPSPSSPFALEVIATAAGSAHTCALLADGTMGCAGANAFGQLGRGIVGPSEANMQTVPGVTNVIAIVAGDAHTCALLGNGTVRCWGRSSEGQIGLGSFLQFEALPTEVPGLSNVVSIAAGAFHTCAVLVDGTARCWGLNADGQVGDGTGGPNTNRSLPTTVSGLGGAIDIAAGASHTCALTTSVVRCWGDNLFGQLGDNTRNDRLLPGNVIRSFASRGIPIALKGITQIVAGAFYTCALEQNGGPLCWGQNTDGQLGDGSAQDRLLPVTVPSFTLNIDPVVTVGNDRLVTVTIVATCEENQWLHVEVDIQQGAASGSGILQGKCTGRLANYPVTVPALGRNEFTAGPAQVQARATIREQGHTVDFQQWTRLVNIIGN
jgi:alpha-tubulin suppressor-like RCC1 family protein